MNQLHQKTLLRESSSSSFAELLVDACTGRRYVDARPPTEPITYVFNPSGANAMLLLPPSQAADSRPLYHISVAMNVFVPTSFITSKPASLINFDCYLPFHQLFVAGAPKRDLSWAISSEIQTQASKAIH